MVHLEQVKDTEWPLSMRGLEAETMDPHRAGWRLRVVPSIGHFPLQTITNGSWTGRCVAG
jgi:hypothetical protein